MCVLDQKHNKPGIYSAISSDVVLYPVVVIPEDDIVKAQFVSLEGPDQHKVFTQLWIHINLICVQCICLQDLKGPFSPDHFNM